MTQESVKALVVYDSVFGNTEQVAKAIGGALSPLGGVEVLKVDNVKPAQLTGLDLLVVGSPTRAFRPTAATSNLLKGIPNNGLRGVKVAAFDTRIATADVNSGVLNVMVKIFGYAAKPISDRLVKKGGELVIPPEGFYVADSEGPLKEGELERAVEWAKQIMETLA
ncbi:MAG: flavodoxin family protein [Candidatus Bathyarchaeota archaeon]|nr:flavodoxin family protein [Candidatus Bathyarchaeota archaeon]